MTDDGTDMLPGDVTRQVEHLARRSIGVYKPAARINLQDAFGNRLQHRNKSALGRPRGGGAQLRIIPQFADGGAQLIDFVERRRGVRNVAVCAQLVTERAQDVRNLIRNDDGKEKREEGNDDARTPRHSTDRQRGRRGDHPGHHDDGAGAPAPHLTPRLLCP
jgi:hypothetical protein